jgi:ligand-binding sensor domain-containing protein
MPSPTEGPRPCDRPILPDPDSLPIAAEGPEQKDWTRYPSLNNIRSLEFAPDGSLWAGTDSGLVHWDLDTNTHDHYDVADGLASDDITDLALASDGTLWIAAKGGVTRFDGEDRVIYREADGLTSNIAYAITVAPDNSVWVGTQDGASHFNGTAWNRVSVADSLANDVVWYVAVAPNGDVWFSTHTAGVVRHRPADDTWVTYGAGDGLPVPNARFLAIGPDGAPWLHVGYHHVYRFDGTRWQLAHEVGGGRWVCDIVFDARALPWIATCGGYHTYGAGLAHPDGPTWNYVTTRHGLLDDDVTAVAARSDGVIAAGSDRGLNVFQAGSWRALRAGPTLNQITAVAITQDGAAWFGFGDDAFHAAQGGVSRFHGQNWQYFGGRTDFTISNNVRALSVAPDGALWAGAGCGVARLASPAGIGEIEQRWQVVATCKELHGNVHGIAFAPNGDAWIATDFNLYHLSGRESEANDISMPTAVAVAPDGTIWVAHSPLAGGRLSILDGHNWITRTEKLPMVGPVTALAVTGDGTMWAGARQGGLARFDGESWQEHTASDGLLSNRVVDLVVSPDDVPWAITDRGLAYFEEDGWTNVRSGHAGIAMNTLAIGLDHTIWIGTSRGALRLQRQQAW